MLLRGCAGLRHLAFMAAFWLEKKSVAETLAAQTFISVTSEQRLGYGVLQPGACVA